MSCDVPLPADEKPDLARVRAEIAKGDSLSLEGVSELIGSRAVTGCKRFGKSGKPRLASIEGWITFGRCTLTGRMVYLEAIREAKLWRTSQSALDRFLEATDGLA